MKTFTFRGYTIDVERDPHAIGFWFVYIDGEISAWTRDPWESTQRVINARKGKGLDFQELLRRED